MKFELMTVADAAEYLATTERHVRDMAWRRILPHVKVGRLVRFDRADLDAWLDANRVEAAK